MDDVWGSDDENCGDNGYPPTTSSIGFTIPLLESLGRGGNMERSTRAMVVKMAKEGFAEGMSEQEKVEMQDGFDEGFLRGQRVGRLCGNIYRKCRSRMAGFKEGDIKQRSTELDSCEKILDKLETIFFLKFPEVMKERSIKRDAGAFLRQEYQSELQVLLFSFINNQDIACFLNELETLE